MAAGAASPSGATSLLTKLSIRAHCKIESKNTLQIGSKKGFPIRSVCVKYRSKRGCGQLPATVGLSSQTGAGSKKGCTFILIRNSGTLNSFPVALSLTIHCRAKMKKYCATILAHKKDPDFMRNQDLFGGDCWTRTSDLLRVKIRCAPESVAPQRFPALLRAFGSVGDPLCPPYAAQSFPRLGHGLGQVTQRRRNDHAVIKE